MPSIVVLTGVVGAGKSTVASRFSESAFVVRTDAVQFDAARRAFPFLRKSQEQNWEIWPRDLSTMHINRLFNLSLTSTYPELLQHRGNVIVEGTIICRDWFQAPLIEEIKTICRFNRDVALHRLDLIPTAEVLQQQILARGKPEDLQPFSDIAVVRQHIQWAQERTDEGWIRFQDSAELESAIREIFESKPVG
jgi:hypothetical protein